MRKVFKFVKGKRQNSDNGDNSHCLSTSLSTELPIEVSKLDNVSVRKKKMLSSYSLDGEIVTKSDENCLKDLNLNRSVLLTKVKEADRVSVLSGEQENVSVTCSPQLATIPPPCKPLRSLEYLNSMVKNESSETNAADYLMVETIRSRHISFTESQQSLSTKGNRYSYEENSNFKEEISTGNLQNVDKQSTSASGSDWGSDKSLPLSNLTSQSSNSNRSNYKKNRPHSDSFEKQTIPEVSPRKSTTRHFKRYSLDYNHSSYWTETSPSSSKQPYIFANNSPIQENVSQIDIDDILESNRRINAQLESYDDAIKHLEKCDLNRLHRKSMSLPRTELKNSVNEFSKKDCKSLPRSLTSEDAFKDISAECDESGKSDWQEDKIAHKYGSINSKHHFFVRMKHILDSKWKTMREKKNKFDGHNGIESNLSGVASKSLSRDVQRVESRPHHHPTAKIPFDETSWSSTNSKEEVLLEAMRAEDIQQNLNEVKQILFGKKNLIEILKNQITSSQQKCSKYVQEIVELRNLQNYVDNKFSLFIDAIDQCYQIDARINAHLNNPEDMPVEYEALKKEVIKWRKQYESLMKKIECMEKETAGMQSVLRSANLKFKLEKDAKYLEAPSLTKDVDLVEVIIQSKDFPGNVKSSSLVMQQNDAVMEALKLVKKTITDSLVDCKMHSFSFCEGNDIHEVITNLQQENLQLKLQNAHLLEKYESDLTNTHERLLGTVQTLKEGTYELNEKVTENNMLKNDMAKLLHEHAKTESEFYDMSQQIQELNKVLVQCKCMSDSYKLTNDELTEQLKAAVIEKCKLTTRLTELDSELGQVKEEFNASRKEAQNLKVEASNLGATVENFKAECIKQSNTLTTKDNLIESYQKQLKELKMSFDEISILLSNETSQKSDLIRTVKRLESDLKDKCIESESIKEKNAEIKSFYSQELSTLRSQITRLEVDLQSVTAERNCLKDEIKTLNCLYSAQKSMQHICNDPHVDEETNSRMNSEHLKRLITKFNTNSLSEPKRESVPLATQSIVSNSKRLHSSIKPTSSIKKLNNFNDEIKPLESTLSYSVPDLRINLDQQKQMESTKNDYSKKTLVIKKSHSLPNVTESWDTLQNNENITKLIREMSSLSKAKIIALHQEQWANNMRTIENLQDAFDNVKKHLENNEGLPLAVHSDLQVIKSVIKTFENKLCCLETDFTSDSQLFESFDEELKYLESRFSTGNSQHMEELEDLRIQNEKDEFLDQQMKMDDVILTIKKALKDSKSLNNGRNHLPSVKNMIRSKTLSGSLLREPSSNITATEHYRGKLTEAIKVAADLSNNHCNSTYMKELNILKKSKQKYH